MATTGEPFGLFWDSENGDRTYSAASFEYWLKKFFTSGVFNGDLQVLASSGMTLEIQPGYANADGKVKFWNGAFNLTLNAANSTYPRIDTIVITRDNVNRQIVCEVVTGSYSGDVPQPTAPVRNSEIYQLVLAQIYVGAGVTGITQSNITDTRPNNELCGYITGTVEELDFSAFTAQFEAYFAEFKSNKETDYASWFNAVQQQQIQDKAAWDAWYAALQEELHNLPEDSAEYLQIQIDELKESGLSGSIFKITTINASLEGKTVTISNADNTEVRSATFDENLECMIYGFKSVGQITITSTDGIQTATSVVTIPYFGNYTFPIAFWAATVNIQGDTNLYGATITVKDSDDLTVGTVTLSAIDGTGTFTATKADTYSFNYTYQGTTYSQELVVSEETTYALSLSAGFSWTVWVDTAQHLDSTDYASLSEVLADEEAVRELFLEHACVDYMAEATSSNADLETIIENDLCAKWINNSDYALDFLEANTIIKSLMDAADKYGYGEWVNNNGTWGPKGNVPVMTDNNAPYGVASATVETSGHEAYKAFDGDDSTYYDTRTTSSNGELIYKFVNPTCVRRWKFVTADTLENFKNRVSSVSLYGSNDGSTWSNALDTVSTDDLTNILFERSCNNDSYYLQYKIIITKKNSDPIGVATLQFYGRSLSVSVPTMTSNTAPYGEAIILPSANSSTPAWKMFDKSLSTFSGVSDRTAYPHRFGYIFNNKDIVLKMITVQSISDHGEYNPKNCSLEYTEDGTTWEEASETFTLANSTALQAVPISGNSIKGKGFRIVATNGYYTTYDWSGVGELQFYGLDYSEKEFEVGTTKKWLYDHGVEIVPISVNTNNANATATKEDSQVVLTKVAASATVASMYNTSAINLSAYNLVRAVVGDILYNGNDASAGPAALQIHTQVPIVPSSSNIATVNIGAVGGGVKEVGLNISSINQSAYVVPNVATNSYTSAKSLSISELWLE